MIINMEKLEQMVVDRAKELAQGCSKVFVATSGGIDSSTVVAILCKAFGSENVVGLYRNIRSSEKHWEDVVLLENTFHFRLLKLDLNEYYEKALEQLKSEFKFANLYWCDEDSPGAKASGFTNAYASLKSCMTTPFASFISKAIDEGRGRIFGTGNGEEDGLLRYFDKRGDGAVDNNILNGLTKAEVRQLARHLGVPEKIIIKKPSADLEGNGDVHNDEEQLSEWARQLGFDIQLSYGAPDGSKEGNIAWAWKEDITNGVITGIRSDYSRIKLQQLFDYSDEESALILFLRIIEKKTRHKVDPIPGMEREELLAAGVVD